MKFKSIVTIFILIACLGLFFKNQVFNQKLVTAQTPKINAVVIMLDDLDEASFDQMLSAGKLPNIKEHLVDKGMRFLNSFVSESLCCPSRATFLTGKYPHNCGTYNVMGDESGMLGLVNKGIALTDGNIITSVDWLPSWLDNNDYFTGHIGKFMNTNYFGGTKKPGFDYWQMAGGFDARPGNYKVTQNDNSVISPDIFQTKYFGDQAVNFINQFPASGQTNFFLNVAPMAPHVAVPQWIEATEGQLSNEIAQQPIAGYNTFNHPDSSILERRQITILDTNQEYLTYYRDKIDSSWTGWVFTGNEDQLFSNTNNLPIVAFSAFKHPDINGIRQHLIRGTPEDDYTMYYRNIIDGQSTPWTVSGLISSLIPNTGALPVIGYSATNLSDPSIEGGDIGQFFLRGDEANGYELYSRARINNSWTQWLKEPEMWDLRTSTFPIESFDAKYLGNGLIRVQIIRKTDLNGPRTIYENVSRSPYAQINVLGESTDESSSSPNNLTIFVDEDAQFSGTAANVINPESSYPHIMWGSRVFADSNWINQKAEQSYPTSWYPGGIYPAGTLRQDGKNGFLPVNGFDLTGIQKNSFNNCSGNLAWICQNWPDITTSVVGGKTQLDYLKRSHLDRLESLISVDVLVGQIINQLEQKNLLDNTLIIFTSDNGYFEGEHRLGNKMFAYEESIRVPLIIRPPNSQITSGKTNTNTVVNLDLAATIMDYAGLWNSTYQAKIDGRSLKPILDSLSTQISSWRKWFLIEYRYPRPDPDPDWKWAWGIPDFKAIRTGLEATDSEGKNYLYVEYTDDPFVDSDIPQYELFDINADSSQINNQQNNPVYALKKSHYTSLIPPLLNCAGDTCRTADFVSNFTPLPEDLNNDGVVNGVDYKILLYNYGSGKCGHFTDIDANCVVNSLDAGLIIKALK